MKFIKKLIEKLRGKKETENEELLYEVTEENKEISEEDDEEPKKTKLTPEEEAKMEAAFVNPNFHDFSVINNITSI
jgi:hypothetical protein